MQRLNYLDAQFLHVEEVNSPMHIANVAIFEGPVPTRTEIEQLVESKLHLLQRYRQRVRFLPFDLGRPVWVDDPRFYLRYHVRRTALPEPHDLSALWALMGRLMSQLLDRSRPLWEIWVVEGLEDGRWAMIQKSHHAMVDGVNGQGLIGIILDKTADAPLQEPARWLPEAEPSTFALLDDAMRGFRQDLEGWQRAMLDDLKHMSRTIRSYQELSEGFGELGRKLWQTRSVSSHGKLGPHRSYAPARARMADIQLIRKAFGGTINDVVLACVAAGHRALLTHRGDDPERAVIRSLVPVFVGKMAGAATFGNRVSAIFCDLPVHLSDPVQRLRAVSAEMTRLKESHMSEAGAYLTALGDLAAPWYVAPMTRLYARLSQFIPQRSVSTVTTNVPGPREALYCLGRRMLESFPYVPIGQGTQVGTAVLSYDGQLAFGVTADCNTLPDVSVMVQAIEADIEALVQRARQVAPQEAPRKADGGKNGEALRIGEGGEPKLAALPRMSAESVSAK
jgi:diacylglycerol O-acyltransferase